MSRNYRSHQQGGARPVIADLYMRIYFKDFLKGIYISDADSVENSEMFLRVANRLLTQYGCETYPVTPMTPWGLDIPSHPVDKHIMNNLDRYIKHVDSKGREIFDIPATLFEDVMITPVMHYFESFVTGAIDQLSKLIPILMLRILSCISLLRSS